MNLDFPILYTYAMYRQNIARTLFNSEPAVFSLSKNTTTVLPYFQSFASHLKEPI